MMKLRRWAILPIVFLAVSVLQADQRAKTADGREVILRDDGTWIYADETKKDKLAASGEFRKDPKAKLQYTGKRGNFALYLMPGVWKKDQKVDNDDAEVEFEHKEGDAYAMVIMERIAVPLQALKRAALENAKNVDKDLKVVKEEKRTVNGSEVLCLIFEVVSEEIPVTFYAYYYTGMEGSIQVITWTGKNLFEELKPDLEAFLNGFEVLKKKK